MIPRLAAILSLCIALCAVAPAAERPPVVVYMYSEYIDPQIPAQFTTVTGWPLRIEVYEETEELLAKLKTTGTAHYDVIVASDFAVPDLVANRLVRPLEKARIPNATNVAPDFADPPFDRGCAYSLPYQWGSDGIMYRKDKVQGPVSWALVLDPARAPGPFVLLDTARDMLGIALLTQGRSMNTRVAGEVQAAGELLLAAKRGKRCLGFDGGVGGKNKVMAGEADCAVVYNGDAVRAMDEDPEVAFAIPVEGSTLTTDVMLVSAGSRNPDGAHAFIDYILDPKVGAQLSNFTRYATPNAASLPLITPKDRVNPAIYPPPELMHRLERLQDLGADNAVYDAVWTRVKAR